MILSRYSPARFLFLGKSFQTFTLSDENRVKNHAKTVAFVVKMVYNIKAARRWGVSGTLYLQSAIAEPNAFLDEVYGRFARRKER